MLKASGDMSVALFCAEVSLNTLKNELKVIA